MSSKSIFKTNPESNLNEDFQHQTEQLMACILELKDSNDLKLIRKWHDIFCKATREELLARNHLCGLLLEQLQQTGYLSNIFRDENNCNYSLNQLLSQLRESSDNEIDKVNLSQTQNEVHRTEIHELQKQVEILHAKITAQDVIIQNLKSKVNENQQKTVTIEQKLENLLSEAVKGLINYLNHDYEDINQPFNLFGPIFSDKIFDPNTLDAIEKIDEDLFKAFQDFAVKIQNAEKSKTAKKALKEHENLFLGLQQTYESRLNIQNWVHDVRLRAIRRQFSSNLQKYLSKFQNDKSSLNLAEAQNMLNQECEKVFAQGGTLESCDSICL